MNFDTWRILISIRTRGGTHIVTHEMTSLVATGELTYDTKSNPTRVVLTAQGEAALDAVTQDLGNGSYAFKGVSHA